MSLPWKHVLLYGLFLIPLSSTHAQWDTHSYVISERVGSAIDAQERVYFGLFPRSDQFKRAVALQTSAKTVTFVVNPGESASTELTVSREVADELASYIDRFEDVYLDAGAVDWSRLAKVATPVRRFNRGRTLNVTTMSGDHVQGRLLYVDENVMVISRAPSRLAQLRDSAQAVVVFPEAVKLIEGAGGLFSRTTIPQAGDTDTFRQVTIPHLKKRAVFEDVPSPEIRELIRRRRENRIPPATYPEVSTAFRNQFDDEVHLSLRVSYAMSPPYSRYTMLIRGEPVENGFSSPALAASMTALYDFTERLAMQAALRYVPAGYHDQNTKQNFAEFDNGPGYIAASGWFASGLVSYKLVPFDGYNYLVSPALSMFETLEVAFGIGPSVALLELETHPGVLGYLSGEEETYFDRQQKIGMSTGLESSFYMSRSLSVDLNVGALFYPGMQVKERAFFRKEIRPSNHFLVLPDISAGVGFHF